MQCVSTEAKNNAMFQRKRAGLDPALFVSAGVDVAAAHHARFDVLHDWSPWFAG
jgi:hypothetical protein